MRSVKGKTAVKSNRAGGTQSEIDPYLQPLLSNWLATRQGQDSQILVVSILTIGYLATLLNGFEFDGPSTASLLAGGLAVLAGGSLIYSVLLVLLNFNANNDYARITFRNLEFGGKTSFDGEAKMAERMERRSSRTRAFFFCGLGSTLILALANADIMAYLW